MLMQVSAPTRTHPTATTFAIGDGLEPFAQTMAICATPEAITAFIIAVSLAIVAILSWRRHKKAQEKYREYPEEYDNIWLAVAVVALWEAIYRTGVIVAWLTEPQGMVLDMLIK